MDSKNIYFGKNVNTGAIEQIKSVGNVLLTSAGTLDNLSDVVITTPTANQILKYSSPNWINGSISLDNLSDVSLTTPATGSTLRYDGTNWVNYKKQYMSFVMYGTTLPAVYATNNDKNIIASSALFWAATVPNPNTETGGFIVASDGVTYTASTGVINVSTTRRDMVTATLNLNGSNISTPSNFEMGFVNYSTGSAVNFSPNARTVFTQQLDFAGVSGTVSTNFTGVSGFTLVLRIVTAQVVALTGTDCNICITLNELD
jgi:hypothetical protein